jgi:hypothetical protein
MVQSVDDRAALQRALARTGGNQSRERRVDFPKLRDLAADFLLLGDRLLLDGRTVGVRIRAERQQFLYLRKREADLLRLLDKPDVAT